MDFFDNKFIFDDQITLEYEFLLSILPCNKKETKHLFQHNWRLKFIEFQSQLLRYLLDQGFRDTILFLNPSNNL